MKKQIALSAFLVACASQNTLLSPAPDTAQVKVNGETVEVSRGSDSENSDCLHRRKAWLRLKNGKYARFLKDWEAKKFPEKLEWEVASCFYKDTVGGAYDSAGALNFYVEGHQYLGSFGKAALAQGSAIEKNTYTYYADSAPKHQAKVKYFKGTLRLNAIYPDLQKEKFLTRGDYFSRDSANNFYVLLDRWNAFVEGLDLAVDSMPSAGCAVRKAIDQGNAVMEFEHYTAVYLKTQQVKDAKLFKQMAKDKSVQKFVMDLDRRSAKALDRAKKYPCLFDVAKKAELEKQYVASAQQLRKVIGAR